MLAFSQYTVARLWSGHLNVVATVTWLPLLFLLMHRSARKGGLRWSILGAVCVAMILLPGFLQVGYHLLLASGFYLVFLLFGVASSRKRVFFVSWVGMIAGGLALSAIQLVPTYQLIQHSSLEGGIDYSFATEGSIPPWYLVTSLAPGFFGIPGGLELQSVAPRFGVSLAGGAVYLGVIPLILVAATFWRPRRDKTALFFLFLIMLFLLLSFGKYSPLYWVFYQVVPGYDMFRIPAHHLVIVIFSLSILTGLAVDRLWRQRQGNTVFRLSAGLMVFLLVILISGLVFRGPILDLLTHQLNDGFLSRFISDATEEELSRIRYLPDLYDNALRSLWLPLLMLSAFCVWWLVMFRRFGGNGASRIALVALILGGLLVFNLRWTYQDASYYEPVGNAPSLLTREFSRQREPFRVLLLEGDKGSPNWRFKVNAFGLEERIEIINGYDPIILKGYASYSGLITGDETVRGTNSIFTEIQRPELLDLLNIRYVLSGQALPPGSRADWELVGQEDGIWLYANPGARPRAYIAKGRDIKFVQNRDDAFKELSIGLPEGATVIQCGDLSEADCILPRDSDSQANANEGRADITDYRNDQVRLRVETEVPAYLVLSDVYYPGWTAYVDGERRDVLRANGITRAVRVGPGDKIIEFRFRSTAMMWGGIVSGATLAILVTVGIVLVRSQRRGTS